MNKIKISTFTHFYLLISSPFISPFFYFNYFKLTSLIEILQFPNRSKLFNQLIFVGYFFLIFYSLSLLIALEIT